MNKYQSAYYELIQRFYSLLEFLDENVTKKDLNNISTIKELIEKATDKKAKNIYDENESCKATPFYEQALQGQCPHCYREVQPGMSYCSNCGQALDWGDEEE